MPKVLVSLNRSVARVTIEPLKLKVVVRKAINMPSRVHTPRDRICTRDKCKHKQLLGTGRMQVAHKHDTPDVDGHISALPSGERVPVAGHG